jgi:hypothetical protein
MDLPDVETLRSLVASYAALCAAHGGAFADPPLVQPTGEFFPDEFRPDPPSVVRLLRRMMGYAPIADDLGVEIVFFEAEQQGGGGGCGSIACGEGGGAATRAVPVQEVDDGYRVFVCASDVGHSDLLTTSLARSVGGLVLHEAGADVDAVTSEIAAAACGFGVLLANGAAVWGKSCGGLRMASATVCSIEEATTLLALFVAVHGRKAAAARAHLGATQREAFDLAQAWVESNPLLVESLRDRPEVLEGGSFAIEPVRGLVGRWLHKRKLDKELSAPATAPPPSTRTPEQQRRFLEAKALVDEVMGEE